MERVYIETTIPSYLVSDPSRDIIILARQELTKEWWSNEREKYKLLLSEIVIEEITDGNKEYANKRLKLIKDYEVLILSENVIKLARQYMDFFNFPDKLLRDIFHVSFSIIYNCNFLLTWNCKHIANAHFRQQLLKYNIKLGLKTPDICTPEELSQFN